MNDPVPTVPRETFWNQPGFAVGYPPDDFYLGDLMFWDGHNAAIPGTRFCNLVNTIKNVLTELVIINYFKQISLDGLQFVNYADTTFSFNSNTAFFSIWSGGVRPADCSPSIPGSACTLLAELKQAILKLDKIQFGVSSENAISQNSWDCSNATLVADGFAASKACAQQSFNDSYANKASYLGVIPFYNYVDCGIPDGSNPGVNNNNISVANTFFSTGVVQQINFSVAKRVLVLDFDFAVNRAAIHWLCQFAIGAGPDEAYVAPTAFGSPAQFTFAEIGVSGFSPFVPPDSAYSVDLPAIMDALIPPNTINRAGWDMFGCGCYAPMLFTQFPP